MFSHITIGSQDLDKSGRFFDAVLTPLGLRRREVKPDGGPEALCWVGSNSALPRFYAHLPFNGQPPTAGNGSMVAFLAPDRVSVDRAWRAGLANGGSDEGAPGERAHYGAGYYGAYLRDPDGNKIHVVYRGDLNAEK